MLGVVSKIHYLAKKIVYFLVNTVHDSRCEANQTNSIACIVGTVIRLSPKLISFVQKDMR